MILRIMTTELATSENEVVERHSATNTTPAKCQFFTVKEEPVTDYPDAILPYFDPRSVKKEVAWSPLPSLVPQCLKLEIKDEVIVEEHDMVGHSYDAEAILPHSQIMEVWSDDVNPDELPGSKEEQTTCFVDVDTLQTLNSSCDEVFSDPLMGEEEDLAENAMREEDESSHNVIVPPVLRRSGRTKKWEMLRTKIKVNLPNVLLKPKSVCTYQRACHDEDNNLLPKLRSGATYQSEQNNQDKSLKVKMIPTTSKRLTWMKQQKQKVEQHILEVRTQKAIEEKRFQTNSEQSWREVGMRYRPNVSSKLLAEEGEVKIKDPLNNRGIQKLESESESLTCSLCNEKFPDHMPQSKHVLSCIRTKPYSCYMCGMSFHGILSRVSHVMTHHRMEGEHVCHQCGKLFPQMKDLENHRAIYCGIDFVKYPCSVCNEEFGDMSSQIRHSMKHINESEQCREGLQHSNMAKVMLLLCTPKNEVKDPLLLDQELIQNPSKTHPLQNNVMLGFLCKVCGKVFKNHDFLDKHQQTEHSLYVCYVCSSRYHYERSWLKHIKHQHYSLLISYPCPKCNQSFTSLPEAVLHEKYHIQQESLLAIETVALTTPPKVTSRKGRPTSVKKGNKGAAKDNSGTGPYACYACGKTFHDLSTRAVHVFSHIGQKPFSCPTCNLKFTVKTNLDSHMTTHL